MPPATQFDAGEPSMPASVHARRAASILVLLLAADALAQEGDTDPLDRVSFEARAAAELGADADLDEGDGTVSASRVEAMLAARIKLNDTSALDARIGSEFSFYDFEDAQSFDGSSDGPLDDAARYDLALSYSTRIDEHWAWFAGGSIAASPAEGADWNNAITGGGTAGATYTHSDTLRLGLGLAVSSRLEDNPRFIPIPILDWRFAERWRLHTTDRPLRLRGLQLTYSATESLDLFLVGGWASREYRLDDDAATPDGVFRDERAPLLAGAAWRFAPGVELDAALGTFAWTNFELLDSEGDEVADSDADPSLAAFLSISIKF